MALHDITLQHITNTFNGKVTIQKTWKIRSKYTRHYGTESKGRAQFLIFDRSGLHSLSLRASSAFDMAREAIGSRTSERAHSRLHSRATVAWLLATFPNGEFARRPALPCLVLARVESVPIERDLDDYSIKLSGWRLEAKFHLLARCQKQVFHTVLFRKAGRARITRFTSILELTRNRDNQHFTRLASISGRDRVRFVKIINPQMCFGFLVLSNEVHRLNGSAVGRHRHQCHLQGGIGRDFKPFGVPLVWSEKDCPSNFVCDA